MYIVLGDFSQRTTPGNCRRIVVFLLAIEGVGWIPVHMLSSWILVYVFFSS